MTRGRHRILVVDDRAVNRELAREILEHGGYEVAEAEDGVMALARVREQQPDLVIADVLMPTMDGFEFVRRMRSDPAIAATPVIFLTAFYHEAGARDLAGLCGVAHVLTKPLEPEALLDSVSRILGEVWRPRAVPPDPGFQQRHLQIVTDKLSEIELSLAQEQDRLAVLTGINLHLASERDPKRLLDEFCSAARSLIGARHALLVVGQRDADDTIHFSASGIDADVQVTMDRPGRETGILKRTCVERRAVRCINASGDPDSVGLPRQFPKVHTLLAAPVVSPKHVYGAICLAERIGVEGFTDEDERLLVILAAQVGRIYENGSLYRDIRESEERFRQLAESIQDVFYLYEFESGRLLYVNPAYAEIWGRSVASLFERPMSWMDAIHPLDAANVASAHDRISGTGSYNVQYRIVRPDGAVRWIHDRGYPLRDEAGNITRVAGIAEDCSARKASELAINRLSRVYAMLSSINTLIVRVRSREQLFDGVCRIAVELGNFGMVWVGLVDAAAGQIRPASQYGFESEAHRNIVIPLRPVPGTEDWGTAWESLAERKAVVDNDIAGRPDLNPLRRAAVAAGHGSLVVLPLLGEAEPLGVLFIYAREAGFFNDEEMRLLNELAANISFALAYISKEETIEYLAFHDPRTGLANRVSLHRRLTEVLEEEHTHARSSALILLNINDFHEIVNSLGHHNGDRLLAEFAQRLRKTVWDSDMVSSLGGDEFAILLPRLASRDHIALVVRKILDATAAPFTLDRLPVVLEVRMGSATAPDQADSADQLWQRASIAMRAARDLHLPHLAYESKIDHYDPQRLAMISGFRKAIDAGELVLHYQPQIDLARQTVSGVESLVRWQHPELGLIFPDAFLPLVERTSLIDALTTWVLANAMRQHRTWAGAGMNFDVAVNLSVRNLQNPDLVQEVTDLARSSRFPLQRLTLEITESDIMVDPARGHEVLSELRRTGVELAVDDFGTGHSSLGYLKDLPVSQIKIDKSFVMGFHEPGNASIVRLAVDLGHHLGMRVTAEGIEDQKSYEALRTMGCDHGQGYHIGKPMSADKLVSWMGASPFGVRAG